MWDCVKYCYAGRCCIFAVWWQLLGQCLPACLPSFFLCLHHFCLCIIIVQNLIKSTQEFVFYVKKKKKNPNIFPQVFVGISIAQHGLYHRSFSDSPTNDLYIFLMCFSALKLALGFLRSPAAWIPPDLQTVRLWKPCRLSLRAFLQTLSCYSLSEDGWRQHGKSE